MACRQGVLMREGKRFLPAIVMIGRLTLAFSIATSLAFFNLGLSAHGADGFEAQMKSPTEKLNTGVIYWIELNRAGVTSHVTQKETFKSGDKIRFHVKPNIDGYAYVVLKSGSRGERSVLYPMEGKKDDNHVTHGVEFTIPGEDFLFFDSHPGVEKVSLTLSRNPIDDSKLLASAHDTVQLKAEPGSKDLVPHKIKVSYSAAPEETGGVHSHAPAGISFEELKEHGGNVTIVQEDPDSVLNVDVDLNHAG
jgi:hypothetical protein